MSLMDFGLVDKAYVLWRGSGDSKEDLAKWNFEPQEPILRDSEDYWFCFLQNSTCNLPGITPDYGNVVKYVLPSRAISSDPRATRDLISRIVEKAYRDIMSNGVSDENINFLGVSTANIIPFYLIGNCGYKANRVVAVSPGADFAECITTSIATKALVKKVRKENGNPMCFYKAVMRELDPISYAGAISEKTTLEVYLGTHDKMVPPKQTEELISELEQRGKSVHVTRYEGCGHVTSILRFCKEWQNKSL